MLCVLSYSTANQLFFSGHFKMIRCVFIYILCIYSLKIQCPTAQPCYQPRQNKKLASKRGATSFTRMYFGYDKSDMELANYAADRPPQQTQKPLFPPTPESCQTVQKMCYASWRVIIGMWDFGLKGPSIDIWDISDSWLAHCKNCSIVLSVSCQMSQDGSLIADTIAFIWPLSFNWLTEPLLWEWCVCPFGINRNAWKLLWLTSVYLLVCQSIKCVPVLCGQRG